MGRGSTRKNIHTRATAGSVFDEYKTGKNNDEQVLKPGAGCPHENDCYQLVNLLTRCINLNEVNDTTNAANKFDELREEIDHCLEYHGNERFECIIGDKCKYKQKLKECNNNRFVQLHAHFYHDQAVDADEDEDEDDDGDDLHKQLTNEEHIQYKLALEAQCDGMDEDKRQQIGVLEFGTPFMITNKKLAKFNNPKEEILKNTYHSIKVSEWNDLLRKCIIYHKSQNAKKSALVMKEIVALKLYTDFDQLQREFRSHLESQMKRREERDRVSFLVE